LAVANMNRPVPDRADDAVILAGDEAETLDRLDAIAEPVRRFRQTVRSENPIQQGVNFRQISRQER
jgi:hypothetical protein